ncbi:MAG: hypothetical protein RLN89_11260 [Parvibaculum sp.]
MPNLISTQAPCLFLHSFWRSGSTALFNAFLSVPGFLCYYEPLHEGLARLTPAKARSHDSASAQAMGHYALSTPYFSEYEPMVVGRRGVAHYPAELAYGEFFLLTEEGEAGLRRYFLALARHAWSQGRIPVFCLNRSWGRIAAIKALMPGALHIYSLRQAHLTIGSILARKSYFGAKLLQIFDLAQPEMMQAIYPALRPSLTKRFRTEHFYKRVACGAAPEALAPLVALAHGLSMVNGLAHADYVLDLSERAHFRDDRQFLVDRVANFMGQEAARRLRDALLALPELNPHCQDVSAPSPALPERIHLRGLLDAPLGSVMVRADKRARKLGPSIRSDWQHIVDGWYPQLEHTRRETMQADD